MRVLVFGGVNMTTKGLVCNALNKKHQEEPITLVITGGGVQGAERFTREWAEKRGIPVETYWADFERHGKRARGVRDTAMLEFGEPNLVIAFQAKANSADGDLVRRAMARDIPVYQPYQ